MRLVREAACVAPGIAEVLGRGVNPVAGRIAMKAAFSGAATAMMRLPPSFSRPLSFP